MSFNWRAKVKKRKQRARMIEREQEALWDAKMRLRMRRHMGNRIAMK